MSDIKKALREVANPERSRILTRFFKTGRGEYAEGDMFLGIRVPDVRAIVKKFHYLPLKKVETLLKSKMHEERLAALLLLVYKYQRGDENVKREIFNFYLKNTKHINNWDLVDLSADKIIGAYLLDKPKDILYKLVKSKDLWERRISILATFQFIKSNQFADTLKISKMLLKDDHDLIHKAVGWMLRELGKRNQGKEEEFLLRHYKTMPRVTLRYAIERFGRNRQMFYLGNSGPKGI